jgi:hypothetical protein
LGGRPRLRFTGGPAAAAACAPEGVGTFANVLAGADLALESPGGGLVWDSGEWTRFGRRGRRLLLVDDGTESHLGTSCSGG